MARWLTLVKKNTNLSYNRFTPSPRNAYSYLYSRTGSNVHVLVQTVCVPFRSTKILSIGIKNRSHSTTLLFQHNLGFRTQTRLVVYHHDVLFVLLRCGASLRYVLFTFTFHAAFNNVLFILRYVNLLVDWLIDWGLNAVFNNFSVISRRPVHLLMRFLVFSHQYSTQQSSQATGRFST